MTGKHPGLRSHTRKRKSGKVRTYYFLDRRTEGLPDFPLGTDYDAALKKYTEIRERAPRIAGTLLEAFERWEREVLPGYHGVDFPAQHTTCVAVAAPVERRLQDEPRMGREVRRVPADWQHPKHWTGGLRGPEERYKPLFRGERYQPAADEWDEECAKWKRGEHPDQDADHRRAMCYEQWAGQRPHRDDYMPNWPAEQRTHLMMYEDTSEGTPISPVFATPEELARWLADNNASAFGGQGASYEGWLRVARGGFAVGMVMTVHDDGTNTMQSGVDAL